MTEKQLQIGTSEFIRLGDALKAADIVSTGGQAKILVQSGQVYVDGKPCTQRGTKLRCGQSFMAMSVLVKISA